LSGVDTGDDSYWKKKNLKTNTTKGLFAGDPHRTALYATGNAHETRYVEFTQNGQPVVYFDQKDLPAMRSRKTYLTVFDAANFKKLPTGEYFSENPGQPLTQTEISDPFQYIASQGWIVRVTPDLNKVFKQVQYMHQNRKIQQYGAEGMSESIAEGADKKYTIKKSYTMSKAGVEKSVWHIMDGDFVVDVTDLRRDAKYYADKWNAAEKESSNASQNLHKQGVAEGKITLSTDPNWYGATVDNYQATGPVVNIPANQLVGFEPDDKMNQPKSKVNVEKIVAGLKQGAKLPPLLVRKYKNGYQVLDGHHRFWAYKLLGVKSIPAQIVPDSDIEEISKQGVAEGKQPGKPVVDAILKVIPVAQEIWFHGSRATGSHRKNSDTDILVIVPDDLVGDQYLGAVRILQKLSSHFDNYDIQPAKAGTNIHRIAQEEGKLLWSKQGVAESYLDELANTSLKVKEPKNFVNVNDRNQVIYKVMKFKSGKDTYLINFTVKGAPVYGKKSNWNAVNVSFGVREEQDDYSFGDEINTDLTARNKNQFLIYSTVINAVRKFITEYNTEIDEIIMQGAGERQAVMYQRFFQSAGKYFPGWHYDGKHSLVRDVPRQQAKKVREQGVAEGMPQPSQGQGKYRDLNAPLGPETPPQMPAGTTKVDVSDTQDWYQLGMDISNISAAKPEEYNQGPPHTVIVFPSDEFEQPYLKQFKRLGLKTHDIDPPGQEDVDEGVEFFSMPLRMSEYRGKHHPATKQPYDSKFKFSGDLKDRVHGLLDAGTKPTLLQVNPRHLLATQDWLSTQGGGKPPFATMKQHPVVLQKNNKLYILDGHHRSADALKSGAPIEVYLFRDEL